MSSQELRSLKQLTEERRVKMLTLDANLWLLDITPTRLSLLTALGYDMNVILTTNGLAVLGNDPDLQSVDADV